MTVGIYIRVSTEEQAREGFSISAQREKLIAYCTAMGWDSYRIYPEEGVSAKSTKRPQLQTLLRHVEESKIKTVLVYRLDRFSRSVKDLHNLLELLDRNGCAFKSATEIYDTSTAMGRMLITIIAAIAEWESDNLGERVRMGQIEKARQGQWSAPAPYGFTKVDKKLQQVPEQCEAILDWIDKIKSGYSLRQLALYADESGVKPRRGYKWHIRTLLDILSNPALYGAMKWRDEIIDGCHEGIITKKDFDNLQHLISSRQNFKKREVSSVFVYQMKLVCPDCGNRLSSVRSVYTRKTDNKQIENNRYECQACRLNGRKPSYSISEKQMNELMKRQFRSVLLDEEKDSQTVDVKKEIGKIEQEILRIENQRAKYQQAWSMDLMTDEEFTERMNETRSRIEEASKRLEEMGKIKTPEADRAQIREIAQRLDSNWDRLSQIERREFVQRFIDSIKTVRYDNTIGAGRYRNWAYELKSVSYCLL